MGEAVKGNADILKIGLIGGTFNPVHTGHLYIAWEAKMRFGLDCVYFVPASIPPHKDGMRLPDKEHRYRMLLLAVEDNPDFIVSRIELDRKGKSYSVDTVERFKKLTGGSAQIYFIIGRDSYAEFETWKSSDRLLAECRFIVAPRSVSEKNFISAAHEKVFFAMDIPVLEISSSYIRNRLGEGCPVKYLLPERVEAYVRRHKLYA